MRRTVDAVPLTALAIGAVSFLAPFAVLKENRVVDGLPVSGAALAGPWLGGAAVLIALAVIAAALGFRPRQKHRTSDTSARPSEPAVLRETAPLSGTTPGTDVRDDRETPSDSSSGSQSGPDSRNSLSQSAPVLAAAGVACLWLTAALLVRAGALLGPGASPRVSPAAGFWGLPAAAYILIDYSRIGRRRWIRPVLAVLILVPFILILAGGRGDAVSVYREWSGRRVRFLDETLVHIRLFATAVVSAAVLGVPLGILASRDRRWSAPVTGFVDAVQTVPSMALFGLLMAPLAALSRAVPVLRSLGIAGIGAAPALIALTLYALLPVVRNTVTGLASVPAAAIEAGRGMGMSPRQLFFRIEWPLALPHILTGLRTASVQAVGNTAVAALIGAGGLGIMIFQGLGQAAPDLILLGVLPLILMAVAVDRIWNALSLAAVSRGLRVDGGTA